MAKRRRSDGAETCRPLDNAESAASKPVKKARLVKHSRETSTDPTRSHIPLAELSLHVDDEGHPTVKYRDIARSVLLENYGSDVYVDWSKLATDVSKVFPSLQPGKKLRWEKSFRQMMSKESCFSMRRNGLQESSFACSIDVQHAPGDWTEQAESKAGIATVSTETPQPPSLSHGELEEVVTAGSERSDSVVHPVPSLTTPVPVTAMPNLEFDVSAVYEHRFKDGSVWYIAKCGPFVLYRRRSDSNFQVKPLVRLTRILLGESTEASAVRQLLDLAEEEDVQLELTGKSAPKLIPLRFVRSALQQLGLDEPLHALLDVELPELPDTTPLLLPAPPNFIHSSALCRYCFTMFPSNLELSRHHRRNPLCMLRHPKRAAAYRSLLDDAIFATESRFTGSRTMFEDIAAADASGIEGTVGLDEKVHTDESDVEEDASHSLFLDVWSEDELHRFFNALSRHSRWRTDLVAHDVGTKTVAQVQTYLEHLAEAAESAVPLAPSAMPVAHEMSAGWSAGEEQLAEDMIIWEALCDQAARTPSASRDRVQSSALAIMYRMHATSSNKEEAIERTPGNTQLDIKVGADITAPVMSTGGTHSASMIPQNKRPARTLSKRKLKRAVQAEFLSSVNWKQLLAVNMGRQQQAEPVAELWDACERGEGEAVRRRVAYLLDEAGLDDIPWYRKEAIYNDIAQAAATNGLQSFDIQDIVRLASTREDNVANRENKKRKLRLRAAQAWTNIPLSICEEKVWKGWPASDGIREELQQASRQVKAVSVSRASFGEAGRLFNLEKLSVLLDLYRYDTEETEAAVSVQAIQALHAVLLRQIRKLVVTSSNVAIALDSPRLSKSHVLLAAAQGGHSRSRSLMQSKSYISTYFQRLRRVLRLPDHEPNHVGAPSGLSAPASVSHCFTRGSLFLPSEYSASSDKNMADCDTVVESYYQVSDENGRIRDIPAIDNEVLHSSEGDGDSDNEDDNSDDDLAHVLAEEARTDEQDQLADIAYEQRLWQSVMAGSPTDSHGEDEHAETEEVGAVESDAENSGDESDNDTRSDSSEDSEDEDQNQDTGSDQEQGKGESTVHQAEAISITGNTRPLKRTDPEAFIGVQRGTHTREYITMSDEEL